MNTPEDWKREQAEAAPCRYCKGLGYLPANHSRGPVPCDCVGGSGLEDDYRGGSQAFERGDDFNPAMSLEWRNGWREAQADEDRNT